MKKIGLLVLVLSLAFAGSAFADATLSGRATSDDAFQLYISTNPLVQGTAITGVETGWNTPLNFSTLLSDPGTYYLQARAWDIERWVAGFLGTFNLNTVHARFENGTQTLSTGIDYWKVGDSWSTINQTPTLSTLWRNASDVLQPPGTGINGSAPWGTVAGIANDAGWIWTNNGQDLTDVANQAPFLTRYFSTKITVTPEPVSLALFGLGIGVLGLTKLRRKKA